MPQSIAVGLINVTPCGNRISLHGLMIFPFLSFPLIPWAREPVEELRNKNRNSPSLSDPGHAANTKVCPGTQSKLKRFIFSLASCLFKWKMFILSTG